MIFNDEVVEQLLAAFIQQSGRLSRQSGSPGSAPLVQVLTRTSALHPAERIQGLHVPVSSVLHRSVAAQVRGIITSHG